MKSKGKQVIEVHTSINASLDKVWEFWTLPEHITHWNFASNDWCCPSTENDLRPGGKFSWIMEAKDGSMGFDFEGNYDQIIPHKLIKYHIADGRSVTISFSVDGKNVIVHESFEAEEMNSEDLQKAGWQAILDNFKKYVESK